jgi:hypothetical protein
MIFCVSANERSGLGALGLGRRRPDGTSPEGAGDPIEAIEPLVTRDGGTSLKTPARSVYTRLVNQGRIPRRRRCGRRTAGRYHDEFLQLVAIASDTRLDGLARII